MKNQKKHYEPKLKPKKLHKIALSERVNLLENWKLSVRKCGRKWRACELSCLSDVARRQKHTKNAKKYQKNVCSVHILLWKTLLGCFLRTLPLPFEAYQRFQVMLNGSGPKWHFSLFIQMKGEKWNSCEKPARNSFQILKNLDEKEKKKHERKLLI